MVKSFIFRKEVSCCSVKPAVTNWICRWQEKVTGVMSEKVAILFLLPSAYTSKSHPGSLVMDSKVPLWERLSAMFSSEEEGCYFTKFVALCFI